jgi:hypothetical protein|nr:MAG TPA_asm: hypothetical protein [Caudoviricetes sp.]
MDGTFDYYSSIQDLAERYVKPKLEKYAPDYDIYGIARAISSYSEDGKAWYPDYDEDFWLIAEGYPKDETGWR